MSDEEMVDEIPDFEQIKSSPQPTSPSQSTSSLQSVENSVILEPRDLSHKIALSEKSEAMTLGSHDNYDYGSPYNSQQHVNFSTQPLIPGRCQIQILEDPEEKFRFRYKSEMQGTHGCIHGKHYSKKSKKFPEVQIINVPPEVDKVKLRVALYTNEKPRKHHVHKVMWKKFSDWEQDFIEVDVPRSKGFKHTWQGLGIIHTSRRFIDETIFNRIKKVFLEQKGAKHGNPHVMLTDAEELTLKTDAHKMGKEMPGKLNTVVLGFEAFHVENGIYHPLCNMAFTNSINNLKNPSTGELKICRISSVNGSVAGGDEVFIFIERVKKGDIQVRFFQLDENDERGWQALASFSEADVHHQFAIAFRTPAYIDQTVSEDVPVFFELFRPSDNAFSEPREFRYKPREDVRLGKRARRSQPIPEISMNNDSIHSVPVITSSANVNSDNTINLGNLITDLLRDEDYMETINEPTPYDRLAQTNIGTGPGSEVIPDLLQFTRPVMELSLPVIAVDMVSPIATDSAGPSLRTPGHVSHGHRELTSEMIRTMTSAMSNLTSICKTEETREKIRQSMMEIENGDGNNIVHVAVITKEVTALKLITEMLSNLNVEDVLDYQNKDSSTPLHLAVETDQEAAVQLLLTAGAGTNIHDKDGETPVHIAVSNRNSSIIKSLLQAKADPNVPNNYGKFPMHIAVENNYIDVVRVLVEAGADVDAQSLVSGKTPLHLAMERNLEDMVGILVREAQVDVTRPDFSDVTALAMAETCRSATIKKIISKEVKKQN